MTGVPLVSIVIPVLNEAADIGGCIDTLAEQDYPLSALEVIVVDGQSDDSTRAAAASAAAEVGFGSFRVLENPERGRSAGLNVGLRAATGSYFVRVDARSRVEPHYVRTCVDVLRERAEVGEVGGAQLARPRSPQPREVGLARAQRNRLTSGFSRYRRSTVSGPAEHVWMGAFRTDELRAIGGWDPGVVASEDFELSQRYIAAGQVVWFDARLQSGYLARPTLGLLARQHYSFGLAKGTWWARGGRPLPRQLVILALPPVALGGVSIFARRFGLVPAVVAAGATALAVEGLGCPGPEGGVRERAIAVLGIATYGASWWTGAVAGFATERSCLRSIRRT